MNFQSALLGKINSALKPYRNLDAKAARDVTRRYDAFCSHYGMVASRNNPGKAHENGAVEAHNNHLQVALDQALILRGSRDFPDLATSRRFVDELVGRRNRRREAAVRIEMAALRPLPARRTTDFTEVLASVTRTGGFLVHSIFYSEPSRLIGKRLRVHVYDNRIEAFLGATQVVSQGRTDQRLKTNHRSGQNRTDAHWLADWGKRIYKTTERAFADAKQLRGHRYARLQGITANRIQSLLGAAPQNIEKIDPALALTPKPI